jgi:CDP-glucose 4,6-dehydratase
MSVRIDPGFWKGRRVLLTGHTGFKGSWCALWLCAMGARVHGLALPPDTDPSLFSILDLGSDVRGTLADIRNGDAVADAVAQADPQIVIHMAAQPLVRRSFREPAATFDTNVMGTVHLLDALRGRRGLEAVLVVTTDKVYENAGRGTPFREADALGGHDPYSASKAAAELVASSYRSSYFAEAGVPLATARGGNVIGGGDFSQDRIVPDIWRALRRAEPLVLRNPDATRPWQHVLDCLRGYLLYAQVLALRVDVPPSLNFGPATGAAVPVSVLAESMLRAFGSQATWQRAQGPQPHEMQSLALDVGAARDSLGFADRLVGPAAIEATAAWYLAFLRGDDMRRHTLRAIEDELTA